MATEAQSDITKIVALGGSLKVEVRSFTAVSNDDTFVSKLANPAYAFGFPTADAAATTQNFSMTVSGKTITFRDPPVTACAVLVFGT